MAMTGFRRVSSNLGLLESAPPEEIVGRMRIWLGLCKSPPTESGECEYLRLTERQSNAFDVRY